MKLTHAIAVLFAATNGIAAWEPLTLCADFNFSGRCVTIDHVPPKECGRLGPDLDLQVSSAQPGPRTNRCALFKGGNCDGELLWVVYPGYGVFDSGWNDQIRSFMCGI